MERAALILGVLLIGCCALVQSQENAQTRIPDSLLDCYRNVSLNHREFRPPMTIGTLIELIRKVEQYPGSNMDMRSLAISLLHRFRLDGIEQNNEVSTSSGVIPFSVKGYQFFKHRILLRSFIQGSAFQFPNESLSAVEQCTMHFMVSNSIDKGKREDEGTVCNQIQSYRSRPPRSTKGDPKPSTPLEVGGLKEKPVKETVPDQDVEIINVNNLAPGDKKEQMFLDDDADTWNPRPTTKPRPPRPISPTRNPGPVSIYPRSNNQPESDCPVENGAVLTPYGTVTVGTLLAGIASGLQPTSVNSRLLNANIQTGITVDNIWASTVAGDLAEVTLLQGPKYSTSGNMKVGAMGGWNSTFTPRWYFIKEVSDNQMTDSEIRGGIDGLIIGSKIQDWNSYASNRLKLSQVLDMYYSERGVFGDNQYRACTRKDKFTQIAPRATMEQQTEGFATILDPQMINEAYLEEGKITELSKEAVNRLINYIPSNLETNNCVSQTQTLAAATSSVKAAVDLYVVLDTTWQFRDVQPMLMALMTKLNIGVFGSNLTVITGKEKKTIINATSTIVDLAVNFNDSVYSQNVYGMDVPGALKTELKILFKDQMQVDRQNNIAGSIPKVILFIPAIGHSLSDSDISVCRDQVKYFREYIPDVKIMFLAQGSKERYREIVEDPTRDIFELRMSNDASSIHATLDPLVNRLKEVHNRIINPVCGSSWNTITYSNAQYNAFLGSNEVAYYRLHQNYLYAVGTGRIKVQGYGYGSLKVCYSRRTQYPGNATGSDVTCKTLNSETIEIPLDQPCADYNFVSQCPPYYITVEASSSTGAATPRCFENDCQYPDSIRYTVINEGLTCTGGIGRFLGSPILVVLAFLLILGMKNA